MRPTLRIRILSHEQILNLEDIRGSLSAPCGASNHEKDCLKSRLVFRITWNIKLGERTRFLHGLNI